MTAAAHFDPAPLTERTCADLRTRFADVGYTVDGVERLLGASAMAALGRNETTPARLALERHGEQDPLATMVRLWTVCGDVSASAAAAAFGGSGQALLAAGILARHGDAVHATVDVRPYGDERRDGWIVSDLTPGLDGARSRLPGDYVLGVNEAATTLAQLTVRRPVGRALDLGTGCGIQLAHLCEHAGRVVGTDVNERALGMARVTAALCGLDVDLRRGSLLEPVAGEQFDLVVSNPPFVLSPASDSVSALTYRDSGASGDAMLSSLVAGLPAVLARGGVAQLLGNWAHERGVDWTERLRGWLADAAEPVDAWVVQREVMDPPSYVELWLKDAGLHGEPEYERRYREWLAWFDRERIDAVGMGWIFLRRPATAGATTHRVEQLAQPVEQPFAPAVERWLDATDWLREHGGDIAAARLRVAADVTAEQWARPGQDDPEHLVLRQQGLARRAIEVDTALAGFVGACDGELTVAQVIGALAVLLELDDGAGDRLRAQLLASARDLLSCGLLLPPVD